MRDPLNNNAAAIASDPTPDFFKVVGRECASLLNLASFGCADPASGTQPLRHSLPLSVITLPSLPAELSGELQWDVHPLLHKVGVEPDDGVVALADFAKFGTLRHWDREPKFRDLA